MEAENVNKDAIPITGIIPTYNPKVNESALFSGVSVLIKRNRKNLMFEILRINCDIEMIFKQKYSMQN